MRCLALLAFLFVACSGHRAAPADVVPDPRFDAELSAYPYPHEVRFFSFTSQGQEVRMAYMDVSPARPSGRTVLLLHGKNFPSLYWQPTIHWLTERGYRVLAPDQIGFGKSSKPERYQYTFHQLAASTAMLLDTVGVERVTVIGHSMGGMLATRFALLFPALVEQLILVNPLGLEDWQTVVPYRTLDRAFAAELETTPDSIRAYQKASYYDGHWTPAYETLIEASAGMTRHPDYPKVAWASALTADMIFTQPVVHDFPRLAVPTLLIVGQRDRTAIGKAWAPKGTADSLGDYPTLGRRAAAAIPGAALIELPGVGHMPQVEDFDAYAGALATVLPPT